MPDITPTYTTLEVATDLAAIAGAVDGVTLPPELASRIRAFAELSVLLVCGEENTVSPEMVVEAVLARYGM